MRAAFLYLAGLLTGLAIVGQAHAQSIQGNWQGTGRIYGAESRVVLHIMKSDGALRATFDVPDNFDFNNAVGSISLAGLTEGSAEGTALKFAAGDFNYEGTVSADFQTIQGVWVQGEYKRPVAWTRQSEAEISVVERVAPRLLQLVRLPVEGWRYHVGDVPHGEASDLDDSDWQTVRSNAEGPKDAVWYRCSVQVPKNLYGYDLTGTRIWFGFHSYANGPIPEIIYFNGRRVAMGDDLEPIVLLDSAKPGDKVLVAVKLLSTVDLKHFWGADLRIDFASSRPNPADLEHEIGIASTLARSLGADAQAVQHEADTAANQVDLNALQRADQKAFDASLEKAHATLELAKSKLQKTSVQLTGNSHIDAAWLWPWTETVDVVRHTFGTALQLMEEYPKYTYTQSAAAYSEWMCDKYPAMCQQIAERVKQGRWEMVGGMWVEPDLNMPDGESLTRHLLVGKRYFKNKFGVDVRIGWNPDSFGYNWQLPQIYKKSGIDYFVTQKMEWNDTNQLPLKLFWWQSPDGSRVLSYFPHGYGNDMEPLQIMRDVNRSRELNPGVTDMMHLFGVGDHGGGPTRAMLDDGLHWSDPKMVAPPTSWGVAQTFFSDVEKNLDTEHSPEWNYKLMAAESPKLREPTAGKISLPIWNDELYFEYHRGVMTTQASHKRNMRESEQWVLNAEKYSSLAWLAGRPYPGAELTEAWKKVLFNQFHDLAAGSGIGAIYKDAQKDYDAVRFATQEARASALQAIVSDVNTKSSIGGVPVMVVNSLAWERTDLVKVEVQLPEASKNGISVLDAQGKPLPFQMLSSDKTRDKTNNTYQLMVRAKDVPSLGYEILHVVPGERTLATDLKASGLTLENAALRVTVDAKTGCITSLYDKRSRFESIAAGGCGNVLVAFKDTPKEYDAWNIDADFEKSPTQIDNVDSVELVERGPLRASIRVTRTWQSSKFAQEIVLYAGLDRVDVFNDFDWHETHVLLKAAFTLAASSGHATYEIPYGSIERPTTRNNSWEAAKFEVPALRWADLGDGEHGFSLINESKYGYDAKGNVLRISLLRSPVWPDPDADRGQHHFSYSLYPHSGNWKAALTVRRGYEFNYKLEAMQVQAHDGRLPAEHAFVTVKQPNVVLTAMKKAEDGNGLILRFYEWAGKNDDVRINLPKGASSATLTNLMEQAAGATLTVSADNELVVPAHPYEIVTVRVDYPQPAIGRPVP